MVIMTWPLKGSKETDKVLLSGLTYLTYHTSYVMVIKL